MCRHLGYLGLPRSLAAIVTEGPTSLYRQSYEPQHQRHGTVNADGWGIGWFTGEADRGPARHRSARAIWSDAFVTDVGPFVRTRCAVAAVRSATPPAPVEESGAAPFTDGRSLFSHNGAVDDFAAGVGSALRRTLAPEIEGTIAGATDSEVLFACVRQAQRSCASLPDAVAQTVHAVLSLTSARLNLIVAEPDRLIATAMGDTLFTRRDADAAWLASEPTDEEPGWVAVPDGSLVVVTAETTSVSAL